MEGSHRVIYSPVSAPHLSSMQELQNQFGADIMRDLEEVKQSLIRIKKTEKKLVKELDRK
jgi:hypothetical protein